MKKPPVIHDFKNDRSDLTPPLPAIMVVLPFLFYATIVGSITLASLSFMATKKATIAEEDYTTREQQEQGQISAIQGDLKAITEEQTRAKEVEGWIRSTQPLMSMVTGVINSVKAGNTLTSLRLARTPENAEHIEMTLLINNGGSAQVEDTRNALSKEGLQAFREDTKSADRANRLGDITYNAVFVKTGSAASSTP